jgi:acyl-CoA reductase-like NAD-dependent aldehyde dehydrogenase
MSVFTVLNPATEELVATVPEASAEEADEAIARAAAAGPAWRAVAPGDRARLLRAFAAAVDAAGEELAALEVAGSGHPIGAARWEAGQVRDVLLYYSAAPERLTGMQIPVPGGLNVTFHEPVGVVGLIVPWNFPMPILSWGMAPALAAGNTVLAKPAEATPLTAMRIGELALGRLARRGAAGAAGPGPGGRAAAGRPSAGAQDRVHRVVGGGPFGDGRLRAAGQTAHPGAGR